VSGSYLAQQILDYLGWRSPGTNDFRQPRTDWQELYATNGTAVYVEAAYHDWQADEDWLRTYNDWAWLVALAVDVRLGYP